MPDDITIIIITDLYSAFRSEDTAALEKMHSSTVDNISVMMIVWKMRGKTIVTALCCILYHSVHDIYTRISISYR